MLLLGWRAHVCSSHAQSRVSTRMLGVPHVNHTWSQTYMWATVVWSGVTRVWILPVRCCALVCCVL